MTPRNNLLHDGRNGCIAPPPAEEPVLKPELDEADMEEFAALDAQFMASAEQEAVAEANTDAASGAAKEEEEGDGDDDLEEWSDGPDTKEKSAQPKAVNSYESLKKLQDDSRAREEEFEATWRRIVGISVERAPKFEGKWRRIVRIFVERAPIEEEARRFMAAERQRLLSSRRRNKRRA